ncbi:hypothetical protein EOC93_25275 [Mesorhizobium sp. M6A.T.Ce.TU.002.03.1.1]|uniref:hypothetical protein n=1 Tax=Mesorhizobium sp. M6A.T.Ce.TU.002.03.1.1 TaxID=2496782 RepID=UPI000FCA7C1E|nr:hypothetical protein [Mesorhizobium sp. M6A.T.Ce.TU.002.03.1.1]RUU36349.1 hypothetical protein EOC93_25275 [Mesorhizobium sp. M6A.T.Ce.TU.002.03.1.1]
MKLGYTGSGEIHFPHGSAANQQPTAVTFVDPAPVPHIDTQGRDFKELASYGLTVVGDINYPWMLITLDGAFLKLHKDEHAIWHVAFEKEAPAAFGSFTSKTTALRALAKYADKNGLELKIEYLSNDGKNRLRENPKAI